MSHQVSTFLFFIEIMTSASLLTPIYFYYLEYTRVAILKTFLDDLGLGLKQGAIENKLL